MKKELPDEWEYLKLSGITESINAGGTPRRNVQEYWTDGTIPWVKISDMKDVYISTSEEKITENGLKGSSTKLFSPETILYSIFATIGAIGILKIFATTNQAIAGITPDTSVIDTKYLYYCLQSERQNIAAKKSHATQDNINLTILRNHKIPVPPLETQHKIVAILEKAEETKKLRAQADELIQQLLQSVFLEIFGDPMENSKGWDVKKLGDLGDWTSGGTPSRSKPEYFQGDISWFTAGELNGSYIGTSKEMITNEALEASAAKIFPAGTMLIGMYDSAAFKMGILTLPSSSNQACAAFLPNDNLVNIQFLLNLFKRMKAFFLSQRRGVRQKNLNQNMIKNFEIPLPPLELQQKFAEIVDQIDKTKQYQQQSSQEVDSLFNTLMQKAFTGELVS